MERPCERRWAEATGRKLSSVDYAECTESVACRDAFGLGYACGDAGLCEQSEPLEDPADLERRADEFLGGRRGTGIDAVAWAKEVARRGAGEILLNSMDADGTKERVSAKTGENVPELLEELVRRIEAEGPAEVLAQGYATLVRSYVWGGEVEKAFGNRFLLDLP